MKQTKVEKLQDAAVEVIDDFDTYGEVLQTDGNDDYSPNTAIERLRTALKEMGIDA